VTDEADRDTAALAAEFEAFVARAGVMVPPDRRATILAGYAEFRAQIALLHAPRPHTAEMANIYRLTPLESMKLESAA
jgi:hypothetical protein